MSPGKLIESPDSEIILREKYQWVRPRLPSWPFYLSHDLAQSRWPHLLMGIAETTQVLVKIKWQCKCVCKSSLQTIKRNCKIKLFVARNSSFLDQHNTEALIQRTGAPDCPCFITIPQGKGNWSWSLAVTRRGHYLRSINSLHIG